MLWASHWLPVQVQPQPRGLLILRLSLFWVQSPSKGDNRRLRQRGWDGLLACQELLGNLVRTKPRGAGVSVEENNNFQRFGENGFFKIKRGTGHCGVSLVFYQAHLVHNTMFWSESSECIFSFLLRLVHFTIHLPIVQLPKGIIAPMLGKMFSWFKNTEIFGLFGTYAGGRRQKFCSHKVKTAKLLKGFTDKG